MVVCQFTKIKKQQKKKTNNSIVIVIPLGKHRKTDFKLKYRLDKNAKGLGIWSKHL